MTQAELDIIIREHHLWLNKCGGRGAWLAGKKLSALNLSGIDLSDVDLSEATLHSANLCYTALRNANLRGAYMPYANCAHADLSGANLERAELWGVNFFNTNLTNTCLDTRNTPNGLVNAFDVENGYVVGYRSREAGHIPEYLVGHTYSATWFSTCTTECHPGLYICPTIADVKDYSDNVIKVYTKAAVVHKAGLKYRCRWFKVIKAVS